MGEDVDVFHVQKMKIIFNKGTDANDVCCVKMRKDEKKRL